MYSEVYEVYKSDYAMKQTMFKQVTSVQAVTILWCKNSIATLKKNLDSDIRSVF